jgi:hypothetical protein
MLTPLLTQDADADAAGIFGVEIVFGHFYDAKGFLQIFSPCISSIKYPASNMIPSPNPHLNRFQIEMFAKGLPGQFIIAGETQDIPSPAGAQ